MCPKADTKLLKFKLIQSEWSFKGDLTVWDLVIQALERYGPQTTITTCIAVALAIKC